MIPIDNQPVVFNQAQSCAYPSLYKQRVNQGDKTPFQFKLEVCDGSPNLISNGYFNSGLSGWTQVGTGWSFGSGQTAVKSGTATAILRQPILEIGNYYRCIIDVVSINSDESTNIAEVRFGASTRFFPLKIGVNNLWGRCLGTTNFEIRCNNNSQITVKSVIVYDVNTNYIVTIGAEDGTTLTGVYLNSPVSPYYNTTFFDLDREFVTVTIDWNGLNVGPGCYTIGIADACSNIATSNICNYDFAQGSHCWNVEALANAEVDFAISPGGNGTVSFFNPITGGGVHVDNDTLLQIGVSYTVSFKISSLSGTATIRIQNGTLSGYVVDQTSATISTDGTFTTVITPTVANSSLWIFYFGASGPGDSAVVDYVDVKVLNIQDVVPDFISNKFWLQESHPCTHVLRMSNDNDAYGFSFKTFAPRLRVKSDLRAGRDLSERKWTRSSSGQKKINFADVIFAKDLVIEAIPEYLHNFSRYCTKSNYFYIDDLSYFCEDDEYPDVSWNKQRTEGAVTLEVSENTLQLLQNCDGQTTGGNAGGSGVGGGSGGSSSGGSGVDVIIGVGDFILGS